MLRLNMPPTTLTPFLYQTRTLSHFSRCRPIHAASLHTTAIRPRYSLGGDDIPFDLPPDVANARRNLDPDPHTSDTVTPSERQIFEKIFREISNKRLVAKSRLNAAVPEQAQGDKKARGQKTAEASKKKQEPAAMKGFLASFQSSAPSSVEKSPHVTIQSIMAAAAADQQEALQGSPALADGSFESKHPLSQTFSAADRQEALMRFPPTLRRAARTALGLLDPAPPNAFTVEGDDGIPLGVDPVEHVSKKKAAVARSVRVEAKRREERLRIRTLMNQATTDFELWQVVEKEVFPLVMRLGIVEPPPNPDFKPKETFKKAAKRGRPRKNAVVEVEDETVSTAEVEGLAEQTAEQKKQAKAGELAMEIYGPIYPQLLLESLEMLGKKFTRPSPYAFHILPRIKQLGLTSYVLGISTSFYNSLMELMWTRLGDGTGVINLLEEMRHAGVYFDEGTRSVLGKIYNCYTDAERGRAEGARFTAVMMRQPEYEPLLATRLSYWATKIDAAIRDRQAETL